MTNPLIALSRAGQSIWLDYLHRKVLDNGQLERWIEADGLKGMTSNPSIFEKAIAAGSEYDEQIRRLAADGHEAKTIFEKVAVADIRGACDLFRPIYDASDGADGFVSIEVSPDLARDADGTRAQVRHLWSAVDRPNLMVKIPGTVEGAPVVGEMLAEGFIINITLLYSIEAYERVAHAYIEALEKRLHTSDTGEDEPLVRVYGHQGAVEWLPGGGGNDLDRRHFDRLGTFIA